MKITFLGHSAVLIITNEGEKIIIDPFITNNPLCPVKIEDLRVDMIIVTHGHFDHLGDAVELAKLSECEIVSVVEIAKYCENQGAKVHGMQIGGAFDFGFVKIKLTNALHTSSILGDQIQYLGNPVGVLLMLEGKTIYHAGDTGLFGDMSLIGRRSPIDVALLPIGDNFTMGPEDAIEAITLLKPKIMIPIHYNTWDIINQDADEFKRQAEEQTSTTVKILLPGQSV